MCKYRVSWIWSVDLIIPEEYNPSTALLNNTILWQAILLKKWFLFKASVYVVKQCFSSVPIFIFVYLHFIGHYLGLLLAGRLYYTSTNIHSVWISQAANRKKASWIILYSTASLRCSYIAIANFLYNSSTFLL